MIYEKNPVHQYSFIYLFVCLLVNGWHCMLNIHAAAECPIRTIAEAYHYVQLNLQRANSPDIFKPNCQS